MSDSEFIVNNINDNNNVIVINVNVIILLYKMFIKRINEIIKRKRRSYDIYNNFKFIL